MPTRANDNAGNGVDTGDGYGPAGSPAAGGVDNIDVDDAGQGNDGEDDADIADVNFPLTGAYDLALAKIVGSPTTTPDGHDHLHRHHAEPGRSSIPVTSR